jgi:translation initiation factor 5B
MLAEQGLNTALYWKNTDIRKYVSIVPTSAISGEGVPDLLMLLVQLTQKMMTDRLMYVAETQCTVLEVRSLLPCFLFSRFETSDLSQIK